jgi:hypothetical protein
MGKDGAKDKKPAGHRSRPRRRPIIINSSCMDRIGDI